MEEQWEDCRCRRTGKEEVCGSKGGGRSGGHGENDDSSSTCSDGSRGATCHHRGRRYNCNKLSHIIKFCSERGEKAMMAEVDEESTLL
jgi:hypothetical protein